jgi:hypothetical protein
MFLIKEKVVFNKVYRKQIKKCHIIVKIISVGDIEIFFLFGEVLYEAEPHLDTLW